MMRVLLDQPDGFKSEEFIVHVSRQPNQAVLADDDAATRGLLDHAHHAPFLSDDARHLICIDFHDAPADEQRRGVSTLEAFFGTPLDPSVALPGQLDTVSLRLLENSGVRRVVVW